MQNQLNAKDRCKTFPWVIHVTLCFSLQFVDPPEILQNVLPVFADGDEGPLKRLAACTCCWPGIDPDEFITSMGCYVCSRLSPSGYLDTDTWIRVSRPSLQRQLRIKNEIHPKNNDYVSLASKTKCSLWGARHLRPSFRQYWLTQSDNNLLEDGGNKVLTERVAWVGLGLSLGNADCRLACLLLMPQWFLLHPMGWLVPWRACCTSWSIRKPGYSIIIVQTPTRLMWS